MALLFSVVILIDDNNEDARVTYRSRLSLDHKSAYVPYVSGNKFHRMVRNHEPVPVNAYSRPVRVINHSVVSLEQLRVVNADIPNPQVRTEMVSGHLFTAFLTLLLLSREQIFAGFWAMSINAFIRTVMLRIAANALSTCINYSMARGKYAFKISRVHDLMLGTLHDKI
ncbi:hypothetical protein FGIG_00627 [Fasciola gigantica]|uniref:Uncharacterized protein n=1 Tax=Fasciola gigantica TaxID=46835 RepID=A0A504YC05_FASGI|nr:hypothetical protein FGIG_00627 [Fasciola gigantica]